MRWLVTHGDILDVPADVLVCPANVSLNLSGGVGGAVLLRGGTDVQRELHAHLSRSGRRFAARGEVFVTAAGGLPFSAIVHAVAVDGFYDTTADVLRTVVAASLRAAADRGARTVTLAALATGYGHLTVAEFAATVRPLVDVDVPPIEVGTPTSGTRWRRE